MKDFSIWYISPRTTTVENSTVVTKLITTKYVQIRTDVLKEAKLKIPMSARTHPQGLRDIGKVALLNKIPSLVIVANTLITMLKSKKQNNVVEASYAEIAEVAGVSVRTVNNSVAILLKEAYISKLGKQSYFISPNLAWFGNQVDWSVALFKLEQGTELSKVAKMYGENTLLERQVT